jgi:hypothetical protein
LAECFFFCLLLSDFGPAFSEGTLLSSKLAFPPWVATYRFEFLLFSGELLRFSVFKEAALMAIYRSAMMLILKGLILVFAIVYEE